MATVILDSMIGELRGRIGDLVFRQYNGRTIVARRPQPSTRAPTATQIAQRRRFTDAAAYARCAQADPVQWAFYKAVAKRNNTPPFAEAVADFFRAPVVTNINLDGYRGQPGDMITIWADDRHEVTAVTVRIRQIGRQTPKDGRQTPEDGRRAPEDGRRITEDGGRTADGRRQTMEGRTRRKRKRGALAAQDGRQRPDDGRLKSDDAGWHADDSRNGGALLEQGSAEFERGLWVYKARVAIPAGQSVAVEAVAFDRPGNAGTAVVAHEIR